MLKIKNATLQPVNGYILVEKKVDKDKDSGLVLPETAQEKAGIMELRVIAVSADEQDIQIGDIVKMMSVTKIGVFKYKDEEVMMVSRAEVGCIVREKKEEG
jgi:co-chaperonin GroES (HSP10)